jgi:hypothetical protein
VSNEVVMMNEEKVWNMPSAVAFGLALVAGVVLCCMGHVAEGVSVLAIAGGIAAPQPLVGDK